MTRSPARRALRAAGVLAAVAFVALLAYGLTTKATNSTIDDALSRGEAVPAPGFRLSALASGRAPGAAGRAWERAAADGEVSLGERREGGRRVAELALMDEGTPVWFRLTVDLETHRVVAERMTARARFLSTRFADFGRREWIRQPGIGWRERPYGAGLAFKTRSWFAWSRYAREVRLLSERGGKAVLALMDEGTPVWFRLTVDLATHRVLTERMVARARFIDTRFAEFGKRFRIEAPR